MDAADLASITWRKSSRSGTNAECVEIGWTSQLAAIRDSKNAEGGVLTFPHAAFTALLSARSHR